MTSENQIDTEQIDLHLYLRTILKRKWVIVFVLSLVVLSSIIYNLTLSPIYSATVRIMIERKRLNIDNIKEIYTIDDSPLFYQTQITILQSNSWAEKVFTHIQIQYRHPDLIPLRQQIKK